MRKLEVDVELERAIAAVERKITVANWATVVLVTVGALVGFGAILRYSGTQEGIAMLGDLLSGTTGALWALAGLMLVYVAFLGQQLAILHQKEDLRLTREALMDQRREMETQTELFESQQFETTFFALLSAHQDLVRDFEIEAGEGARRGPLAFETLLQRIRAEYTRQRQGQPDTDSLELAKAIYLENYRRFEQMLGPYFHSLFHILKFVDDRRLPVDRSNERRRYTNFLRARLSVSELVLLFYSGLSEQGAGMRLLIERYAVLKHLSTSRLLHREHRMAYKFTAWARPMTGQPSDRTNEHRARRKRPVDRTAENLRLSETMRRAIEEGEAETVIETLSGAEAEARELGRQASNLQPPG